MMFLMTEYGGGVFEANRNQAAREPQSTLKDRLLADSQLKSACHSIGEPVNGHEYYFVEQNSFIQGKKRTVVNGELVEAHYSEAEALFYQLAPEALRSVVLPERNSPEEEHSNFRDQRHQPVAKVNTLSLGLLDGLKNSRVFSGQIGSVTYTGTLSGLMQQYRAQPEVLTLILQQSAKDIQPLEGQTLGVMHQMVLADFNETEQSAMRRYLRSKRLNSALELASLSAEELKEKYLEMAQANPNFVREYFLSDYTRKSYDFGLLFSYQVNNEINSAWALTETYLTSLAKNTGFARQEQAELLQALNLQRSAGELFSRESSETKLMREAFANGQTPLAQLLFRFGNYLFDLPSDQTLSKLQLGFIFEMQEELGLSDFSLPPQLSNNREYLDNLKTKLNLLKETLPRLDALGREVLLPQVLSDLEKFRPSLLEALSKNLLPAVYCERYQKIANEPNKVTDFLHYLINADPGAVTNCLLLEQQAPFSGFAFGRQVRREYRDRQGELAQKLAERREEFEKVRFQEESFLAEALGHTEAVRESTRERAREALLATSRWTRLLKKTDRAFSRLFCSEEGDSVFHTSTPGKTAKEKLMHSVAYAAPGVVVAGLLGVANYFSEGQINHESLHSSLFGIQAGLVGVSYFLGREASDLPSKEKWRVFGNLKWGSFSKLMLRGAVSGGVLSAANYGLNRLGVGQQLDTQSYLAGLAIGTLAKDQVMSFFGWRGGYESIVNRLVFNKGKLDKTAEILHFGWDRLSSLARQQVERPGLLERFYSATNPQKAKEKREERSTLRLLAEVDRAAGQNTQWPQLTLAENMALAELLNEAKYELMILMGYNEARYQRRRLYHEGSQEIIDNRQILKRIDDLRDKLNIQSTLQLSSEEYQSFHKALFLELDQNELQNSVKRRRLLYALTTGAVATAATGLLRGLPALKHGLKWLQDLVTGEANINYQPAVSATGNIVRQLADEATYEFNPKDSQAVTVFLDQKFDQFGILSAQLQSRGLFTGEVIDRLWQDSLMASYNVDPVVYRQLEAKLRSANLSSEELVYAANLLLRTNNLDELTPIAEASDGAGGADLSAIISYFNQDEHSPQEWMQRVLSNNHLGAVVVAQRPELATKLNLTSTLDDQLAHSGLAESVIQAVLKSESSLTITKHLGQEIIVIRAGNEGMVSEFMPGIPVEDKAWSLNYLKQINNFLGAPSDVRAQVINSPYYGDFIYKANASEAWHKEMFSMLPLEEQKTFILASRGDPLAYQTLYQSLLNRLGNDPAAFEHFFALPDEAKTEHWLYYQEALVLAQAENGQEQVSRYLFGKSQALGLQPLGAKINFATYFQEELDSTPVINPNMAIPAVLEGRVSLDTAIGLSRSVPDILFTRNGVAEFGYSPLMSNEENYDNAVEWLKIELSPQANQPHEFIGRLVKRNWRRLIGFPDSQASGASDYAMTMVDWLAGGPGQFVVGEQAAYFHRPDMYSVDYLGKLFYATIKQQIPQDLQNSFQLDKPSSTLTDGDFQQYNNKVGQLCWKLETYLASRRL